MLMEKYHPKHYSDIEVTFEKLKWANIQPRYLTFYNSLRIEAWTVLTHCMNFCILAYQSERIVIMKYVECDFILFVKHNIISQQFIMNNNKNLIVLLWLILNPLYGYLIYDSIARLCWNKSLQDRLHLYHFTFY